MPKRQHPPDLIARLPNPHPVDPYALLALATVADAAWRAARGDLFALAWLGEEGAWWLQALAPGRDVDTMLRQISDCFGAAISQPAPHKRGRAQPALPGFASEA